MNSDAMKMKTAGILMENFINYIVCEALNENKSNPKEALRLVTSSLLEGWLTAFRSCEGLSKEHKIEIWSLANGLVLEDIDDQHKGDNE